MKKLILQVYYEGHSKPIQDGGYIPDQELAEMSEHRMRLYAESIGSDYVMLDRPVLKYTTNPGWNRFAMFSSEYDEYDEVLYVDADVLVAKRALGVDIFTYPSYHLIIDGRNSSWRELPDVPTDQVIGKVMEIGEHPSGDENWMVNAGVLKMARKERIKMRTNRWGIHARTWTRDYLEKTGKNQIAFNKSFKKVTRRKPGTMSPLWNSTRPWYEPAFFKHYLGHQKKRGQSQWGYMGDDAVFRENW